VNNNIIVRDATAADAHYAETITNEMAESAKARGTGIAKRSPEYVKLKMEEGKAVIAVTDTGEWVGFCYVESWQNKSSRRCSRFREKRTRMPKSLASPQGWR